MVARRTASARPVVGVVGHGHLVHREFGDLPVTGTPSAYLEAIVAAGGRPVILPGAGTDLLDLVDAIVLTGGGDVDPARYGGDPTTAHDVDPGRDADEIAMVRAAVAAGTPLLGICRGLQILAVASGGSLVGGLDHVRPDGGHEVRTLPGSLVRSLLGDRPRTSALHRQAVADPGSGWRATAWATDGTVEAVEPAVPGAPFLGVQWHPELSAHPVLGDDTGPALFGWLVDAARRTQHTHPLPTTQGSDPAWKPSLQNA